MKSVVKTLFLLIFLLSTAVLMAQKPATPTNLVASYQKYNNRIELNWKASDSCRIYRREKTKKTFDWIGAVKLNWYVDKKDLKSNVSYVYYVQTVAKNGYVSDKSNESTGALLVIASDKDSMISVMPPSVKECIEVTLTQSKFASPNFILKFLVASKCPQFKAIQLTLYRSDDDVLNTEKDNFLSEETFDITQVRGSFVVKNHGEPKTGYLILKVATNEGSFIVNRKIE